jgi:5-oxoprolinase (ATP-hydrolysing)
MEGGGSGGMGRNTWVKQLRAEDGDLSEPEARSSPLQPREINVGGKATVWMGKGDRLVIETPGGGAWGAPEDGKDETEAHRRHKQTWEPRGSFAERAAKQAGF